MGAGDGARDADTRLAEDLGELVARESWILLTGGRDCGVMAAASRGAKRVAGSLTVGILPTESGLASPDVDVAVFTGMGNARNAINVLTSDVVVACGSGGPGTASEIALAIKCRKPVVLLGAPPATRDFAARARWTELRGRVRCRRDRAHPSRAVGLARFEQLAERGRHVVDVVGRHAGQSGSETSPSNAASATGKSPGRWP